MLVLLYVHFYCVYSWAEGNFIWQIQLQFLLILFIVKFWCFYGNMKIYMRYQCYLEFQRLALNRNDWKRQKLLLPKNSEEQYVKIYRLISPKWSELSTGKIYRLLMFRLFFPPWIKPFIKGNTLSSCGETCGNS